MATHQITYCPAMPAFSILKTEPHLSKVQWPVSATFEADGAHGTGIAFGDYSRMQTNTRKLCGIRRLPTPTWAMDDAMLRNVLIRFMEERAMGAKNKKWRTQFKGPGRWRERLERAKTRIMETRAQKIIVLDRFCEEYVTVKQGTDRKRIKQLESEIETLDTYLRTTKNDGGAAILAAIVCLYYRTCLDSVGVGMELGLKSPHVRQILYRMNKVAESLGYPVHSRAWGPKKSGNVKPE